MDPLKTLIETDDPTTFFMILTGVMRSKRVFRARPGFEAELTGDWDDQRGYGFRLAITQNLVYALPRGRHFTRETTDVFHFFQDHELIWERKDQPTLVGLKTIQAAFAQFFGSLSGEPLSASSSSQPR